jgi:CRP-like cAMP-binding protein
MVCADVSLEDLLAFHIPIDDMAFEAGATIYNMADHANAVYCVRQGAIKLLRYDVSGNQRIVRFLKKGDVVGLDSVFANEQQHTAIALTATQLCRIPMSHFKDFINKHPALLAANAEDLAKMDKANPLYDRLLFQPYRSPVPDREDPPVFPLPGSRSRQT